MAKLGALTSNTELDKTAVGLGNVDNTSDANKPVATAVTTALGLKQDTLVSAVNIKTINGSSILGSGDLTVSGEGGTDPFSTFVGVLGSPVTTGANATPVDVTGLVFNYAANSVYLIEVFGSVQAAAATTGCGLQLNTSTTVDRVTGTFFHQLANTGTLSGGSTIADDASTGVSSGIPSTNTATPFYFSGVLDSNANAGTAQLRFRSETTAAITINAGTVMRVHKVA
jgi:hypothetical protein